MTISIYQLQPVQTDLLWGHHQVSYIIICKCPSRVLSHLFEAHSICLIQVQLLLSECIQLSLHVCLVTPLTAYSLTLTKSIQSCIASVLNYSPPIAFSYLSNPTRSPPCDCTQLYPFNCIEFRMTLPIMPDYCPPTKRNCPCLIVLNYPLNSTRFTPFKYTQQNVSIETDVDS